MKYDFIRIFYYARSVVFTAEQAFDEIPEIDERRADTLPESCFDSLGLFAFCVFGVALFDFLRAHHKLNACCVFVARIGD